MEPEWWNSFVEEKGHKTVPNLDGLADEETAIALLKYALDLRMYGECAPGGFETWRAFDTSAEEFIRSYEDKRNRTKGNDVGYKDSFYKAIGEYIDADKYEVKVAEVLKVEQETTSSGYCETCYYESTTVEVTYIGVDGQTHYYTYYGDMGELIRALTD